MSDSSRKRSRSVGKWAIGKTLGVGGTAFVKLGMDVEKPSKMAALKFTGEARDVVDEIRALRRVKHAHVVKMLEFDLKCKYPTEYGDTTQCSMVALEYLPHGELFDYIYHTGPIEERVARVYFKQLVAGMVLYLIALNAKVLHVTAVEACHKSGVVHRDIKLQNIIVDKHWNARLSDFGLAHILQCEEDSVMTGKVGTDGYHAPEVLRRRPYDCSVDIFALGVVLFTMINGFPPFTQASKADDWYRPLIRKNHAKFWHGHRGGNTAGDAELRDLLERMLAYNPDERPTMDGLFEHPWTARDKKVEPLSHHKLKKIMNKKYIAMQRKIYAAKVNDKKAEDLWGVEGFADIFVGGEGEDCGLPEVTTPSLCTPVSEEEE